MLKACQFDNDKDTELSDCGSDKPFDEQGFRRALGCFATGVAVVTTVDDANIFVGMTVSSFNSVSLEPPLVLWSIDKASNTFEQFRDRQYFAVNVLAIDQQDLADRFATRGIDRFAGLACRTGIGGVPVLPEFAACFECETENRYDGGDHIIVIGRVLAFEDHETDPLIFYRGRYGVRRRPRDS